MDDQGPTGSAASWTGFAGRPETGTISGIRIGFAGRAPAAVLVDDETAYLLRSPRNAKHLLDGIRELNEGRGVERELKA